jgi:hypothetical protein
MKRSIIISLMMIFLKGTIKRQNATDLKKLKAMMEA